MFSVKVLIFVIQSKHGTVDMVHYAHNGELAKI